MRDKRRCADGVEPSDKTRETGRAAQRGPGKWVSLARRGACVEKKNPGEERKRQEKGGMLLALLTKEREEKKNSLTGHSEVGLGTLLRSLRKGVITVWGVDIGFGDGRFLKN